MYPFRKNHLLLLVIMLSGITVSRAQTGLTFSSLDSLLRFAEKNAAAIRSGDQQSLLAKWTKVAAIGNTINLKSPFTASWTDNTTLPVSYLPAEAFGGPAGTYKEVSLGQQYVTTYAITPQIDIINPSAWARIKSAKLNEQLTNTTNLINKKNLYESVSANYYNIISIKKQIVYLEQNKTAADSILGVVKNKSDQGITRAQELNNATINLLMIQDRLNQARLSLEQSYSTLKVLIDVKEGTELEITETLTDAKIDKAPASTSTLSEQQLNLQRSYLKSEWNVARLASFAPTLSLVFNQSWQQNSNKGFLDANANRFSAQYIGLKLSVPFPLDVNRLTTNYTSKVNYSISKINYDHSMLEEQLNNKQLELDYQKALSACNLAKQSNELKEINYRMSLNQYRGGIISTDVLLTAFTDKTNAGLNYSNALAALKFAESKININNTVK